MTPHQSYRVSALDVHLVDGTYELFRHYYALPSARDSEGREVAAVRGVLASVLGMMKGGATHVAVATDQPTCLTRAGRPTRIIWEFVV
jgi:5'-3' exonuclease